MRFPPHGLDQILDTYGDPRVDADDLLLWEETNLRAVVVPDGLFLFLGKPVKSIRVHNLAAPSFGKAIHTLWNGGMEGIEYGGTYAHRLNRNSAAKLSCHAWGIAIDINPSRAPNGSDPARQDPRIVAAFRDAAFTWGGTFFPHTDPMHFQLASGY